MNRWLVATSEPFPTGASAKTARSPTSYMRRPGRVSDTTPRGRRLAFGDVEWALDRPDRDTVIALRREIVAYLRRHAEPESDLAGAEIVVAELLSNAFEHAPGPAWVSVAWTNARPQLQVHDLGPGFELDARLPPASSARGRGLYLADALVDDLAR